MRVRGEGEHKVREGGGKKGRDGKGSFTHALPAPAAPLEKCGACCLCCFSEAVPHSQGPSRPIPLLLAGQGGLL